MLLLRKLVQRFLVAGAVVFLATGCGGFKDVPLFMGDPEVLPEGVIQEHECLDLWAVVHFASGYLIADQFGVESFFDTLALLTAYEVAEPQFWPYWGENQLNQQCDILFGQLGWLGWYLTEDD